MNNISLKPYELVEKNFLSNQQAEQALLANLLHNNLSSEKVDDFLKPEHFSDALHGRLYQVIIQLIDHGKSANPVTIKEYFTNDKEFEAAGGIKYLSDLAQSYSTIVNIKDYGHLIYDLHIRRNLVDIAEELAGTAQEFSLEETANDKIEKVEKRLFDLATQGQSNRGFKPFREALGEAIDLAEIAYKRESQIVGCTTGLKDFDKWLGGLHPSDLIIIAGRPSMGKTSLATNMAFNAALAKQQRNEGGKVAFFSLEMSAEQLAMRLLSQESQIPSDRIRRGEINKSDFPKFIEVSQQISEIPLFIDDTPALSVAAVRARARRLHRTEGLDLIIIDYLQLLQGTTRTDNRVQEISDISRGLKALAKELNIPVIALSQLSRAVETRDDKRPQLSDLRESGSIEQDADVVVFVYREEYYEARKEPSEDSDEHARWQERMSKIYNQADLIIAKQRHGPIGTVKVFYDGKFTKFGNLAHE
jgi:replicative DNA helicase